jgi:glycosyltransferase involved in cell wall biosynthesis
MRILLLTQYFWPGMFRINERVSSFVERGVQVDVVTGQTTYPSGEISGLDAQAKALIFPSLFESFGLPLLEAAKAGLPILASERDYVRDVVKPVASFDPESALSIARAVLRHQGLEVDPIMPEDPARFIARLKELE